MGRRGEGMYVQFKSSGDWSETEEWLAELMLSKMAIDTLEEVGMTGVDNLRKTTPRDSGVTANSWEWNVLLGIGKSEVSWSNNAHPHIRGNLVRMLYYGYGNRNGGYVPPRDFISPAIEPAYDQASKKIEEKMKNG